MKKKSIELQFEKLSENAKGQLTSGFSVAIGLTGGRFSEIVDTPPNPNTNCGAMNCVGCGIPMDLS